MLGERWLSHSRRNSNSCQVLVDSWATRAPARGCCRGGKVPKIDGIGSPPTPPHEQWLTGRSHGQRHRDRQHRSKAPAGHPAKTRTHPHRTGLDGQRPEVAERQGGHLDVNEKDVVAVHERDDDAAERAAQRDRMPHVHAEGIGRGENQNTTSRAPRAGTSHRARRARKARTRMPPEASASSSRPAVTKKPLRTKNTSTPKSSPFIRRGSGSGT